MDQLFFLSSVCVCVCVLSSCDEPMDAILPYEPNSLIVGLSFCLSNISLNTVLVFWNASHSRLLLWPCIPCQFKKKNGSVEYKIKILSHICVMCSRNMLPKIVSLVTNVWKYLYFCILVVCLVFFMYRHL